MKQMLMVLLVFFSMGVVMADDDDEWRYRRSQRYDSVDAMSNAQINQINQQERENVLDDLYRGDYRAAEREIERDEYEKRTIRKMEQNYDNIRDGYY